MTERHEGADHFPGILGKHGGIRRGGFGNDVACALPTRISAHVVADQDDHPAASRRGHQKILCSVEDAVVDVCGAARPERIELLGNLAFILREGHAQFGFGGKSKQRDLVFGFKRRQSGGPSKSERCVP